MRFDPLALGVASIAVAAVGAVVTAALSLSKRRQEVIAERLADPVMAPTLDLATLTATNSAVRQAGWGTRVVEVISRIARPGRAEEVARIRAKLYCAGIRGEHAVTWFLGTKVGLAFGALIGAMWFNAQRGNDAQPTLLLALVAFALGFYMPDVVISSKVSARQTAIQRGLPDALDLLVTCVEAGLGLDQALQRVAGEVRLAWPLLGEELATTFLEVKAGIPRVEAFRRLATRTGVDDLKSLSATLNQTEQFGTSIALALRIQAEGIRTRRMQKAEERAGFAAVKMTVPLILCILPSLMAIIAGPAMVNIFNSFIKK